MRVTNTGVARYLSDSYIRLSNISHVFYMDQELGFSPYEKIQHRTFSCYEEVKYSTYTSTVGI
jgi:hypothetical protein